MTKNKKLALLGLTSVLGLGVATSMLNNYRISSAEECSHTNVKHYEGVAPTESTNGKAEHWACCDCGVRWSNADKDKVATNESLTLAKKTTATPLAKENVTDASILELFTEKQVRRLDQQTSWSDDADYAEKGSKETGAAEYYVVDGKEATRLSATNLSEAHLDYRSGWSEFRFKHSLAGVKYITYDYKFWDVRSDESSDGYEKAHTFSQFYNAGSNSYKGAKNSLINDNQWHTAVISVDESVLEGAAFDVDYIVTKIKYFAGELYISNVNYYNEIAANLLTSAGWSSFNGGTVTANPGSLLVTGTWQLNLNTEWVKKAYDAGFSAVKMKVEVGHGLGGNCNYLQFQDANEFVPLDENGVGELVLDINPANTSILLRGKTTDSGAYGSNISGANIRLSDVKLLNETPTSLINKAKNKLLSMTSSESGFWRYIHHNGWGYYDKATSAGVNNNTYTTGTVYYYNGSGAGNFDIQPALFVDMKKAGYTNIQFSLKATSYTDKPINKIAYITTTKDSTNHNIAWNTITSTVEHEDGQVRVYNINITPLLNNENIAYAGIQFIPRNYPDLTVNSYTQDLKVNYEISNISFN